MAHLQVNGQEKDPRKLGGFKVSVSSKISDLESGSTAEIKKYPEIITEILKNAD